MNLVFGFIEPNSFVLGSVFMMILSVLIKIARKEIPELIPSGTLSGIIRYISYNEEQFKKFCKGYYGLNKIEDSRVSDELLFSRIELLVYKKLYCGSICRVQNKALNEVEEELIIKSVEYKMIKDADLRDDMIIYIEVEAEFNKLNDKLGKEIIKNGGNPEIELFKDTINAAFLRRNNQLCISLAPKGVKLGDRFVTIEACECMVPYMQMYSLYIKNRRTLDQMGKQ